MQCPKCQAAMEVHNLSTVHGNVEVDRCVDCRGLWFDGGEAVALKDKWMSDYIDDGDPEVGKEHNLIRDIDCPRCGKKMEELSDPLQKHIDYLSTCRQEQGFHLGSDTGPQAGHFRKCRGFR